MSQKSDYISYLKQGMMARGLPEHVADGFLMNFKDESGFNPSINEANPLVAGSLGGRGLYQLTGPRRTAYENFAAERGDTPYNTDSQLDYMIRELNGPESAANAKIMATNTPQEAAQAIVKNFLRPAPEHQASRSAAYGRSVDPYANLQGPGADMSPAVQTPAMDAAIASSKTPAMAPAVQTPSMNAAMVSMGNVMQNAAMPVKPAPMTQMVDNTGAGVSLGGLFANLGKAFAGAQSQAPAAQVRVLKNDGNQGVMQTAAQGDAALQPATSGDAATPGGFDMAALLSLGQDPTALGQPGWKMKKPKVFGEDDQQLV